MAKKTTKSAVSAEPMYRPTMHVEGDQAKKLMNQPVGKKVRMVVEAEITSQSAHRSYMDPKKMNHSVGMEIHRMKPVSKSAPKRGKK